MVAIEDSTFSLPQDTVVIASNVAKNSLKQSSTSGISTAVMRDLRDKIAYDQLSDWPKMFQSYEQGLTRFRYWNKKLARQKNGKLF